MAKLHSFVKLGVNIDHIATLRQARRGVLPDPVYAARVCESAGVDSIVAHLREDRRHIQDADVWMLKKTVKTRFNLEMSINPNIVDIACSVKPDQATLVPEKREELTTEGGLDVKAHLAKVEKAVSQLMSHGVEVSLFIDPYKNQIDAVRKSGAKVIEFHTGLYANARSKKTQKSELKKLMQASRYAAECGLTINAGHGLDYYNVADVACISSMNELNIGYSIICKAVIVGLNQAVCEMKTLINSAQKTG